MLQIINIIAMPAVLVYIVNRFQRLTSKERKDFAFKTWTLLSLLCIAISVASLIMHRDPASIYAEWWPWTSLVYAPFSAGIIIVLTQVATFTERGEGFAWKTWIAVSIVLFTIQSLLIIAWQNLK